MSFPTDCLSGQGANAFPFQFIFASLKKTAVLGSLNCIGHKKYHDTKATKLNSFPKEIIISF